MYVVGTHWKRLNDRIYAVDTHWMGLNDTLPMRAHNIYLVEKYTPTTRVNKKIRSDKVYMAA